MSNEIKPKEKDNEENNPLANFQTLFNETRSIFTSTFEEAENNLSSDVKNENKNSTIQSQSKDERHQPNYDAVSLTFLEGEFEGQKVDLGVGIFESSHSQSAEWQDKGEDHIRNGASFEKLGPRDFSIKAEYYSISEDISQLVENLSHLIELQKTTESQGVSPPKLLLKQGKLKANTVVVTNLSSNYDYPLPRNKGFRHATVDIKLKLLAGAGSEYSTGKPLSPTPLNDYINSISEEERIEKALEQKSKVLLADCLSEEQSDEIEEIIEEGQQNNSDRLMELDSETLMQMAFAGMIKRDTIEENENLKTKLEEDLARVMASKAVNVGKLDASLAESLINDSPTLSISSNYPDSYNKLQPQYNELKEALIKQNFKSINSGSSNADTAKTMNKLFSCGLSIRETGGISLNTSTPKSENREKLDNLNSYLSKIIKGEVNKSELEDKLNISNPSIQDSILENAPYQTKRDFLENSTGLSTTQMSHQIWETFKIKFNSDNE